MFERIIGNYKYLKRHILDLYVHKKNEEFTKSLLGFSSNWTILTCLPKEEGSQCLSPINSIQLDKSTRQKEISYHATPMISSAVFEEGKCKGLSSPLKKNENISKSSLELPSNWPVINCQQKQEDIQRFTSVPTQEEGETMSDIYELKDYWVESQSDKEKYASIDFFGTLAVEKEFLESYENNLSFEV